MVLGEEIKNCLYACYVSVPRAKAVFIDYDLEKTKQMPGFFGVIGAEDIRGANICELSGNHC